jgi:hypothetical protein
MFAFFHLNLCRDPEIHFYAFFLFPNTNSLGTVRRRNLANAQLCFLIPYLLPGLFSDMSHLYPPNILIPQAYSPPPSPQWES